MSWQVASLALVAIVVVSGFAWYERSRPPSQIVALVAALAALAVAGRLIFTPIPNVLATTDIVLITGYAIGGAPGFAVGALTGLVSNFWLGQGPWTPWQMAGWGAVGIAGAALAAATRRRLGRVSLAAACGLAGLAFGAWMDFSIMATYGGEQSLDRYLALSARGLPFNIAHAVGNVVLALVAGPALVRMLVRFRARFEFRWRPPSRPPARSGAAVAAVLIASLVFSASVTTTDDAAARGSTIGWLARVQNADGGFGHSPGTDSNGPMTGWVALGLEAAGKNPASFCVGRNSALDYLRSHTGSSTGDLERSILALEGAGRSADGLVSQLRARRSGNGSFADQVNLTAFGIMALRAAGSTGGNGQSADWLRGAQNDDGGWGFRTSAPSDPDSTGAALQGLRAAGRSGAAIQRGVGYLRGAQRSNGGFSVRNGPVNSQSTAWAVQGLIAAGVNPGGVRSGGRSPRDYLRSQRAGNGHYRYSASSDQTPVWVTAQVLAAVSGRPFPLPPAHGGRCTISSRPAPGAEGRRSQGRAGQHGDGGGSATRAGETPGESAEEATDALQPTVITTEAGPTSEEVLGGVLTALASAVGAGWLWWWRRRTGTALWPPNLR